MNVMHLKYDINKLQMINNIIKLHCFYFLLGFYIVENIEIKKIQY